MPASSLRGSQLVGDLRGDLDGARLTLNFAMAAFSDPVDPNAKFKLKFSSRLFVRRVGICRNAGAAR